METDFSYTLYLDGTLKHVGSKTMYCNATQCVCLLAAYCRNINLSVSILQKDVNTEYNSALRNTNTETDIFKLNERITEGFKLPTVSFKCVNIRFRNDIPEEVSSCSLPAVVSWDKRYVISGLCHIIRFLIKEPTINPNSELIKLLGHKKFCLKAAFEVSSRTNLCEVSNPAVIDHWLPSNDVSRIETPHAIREFEALLDQPVAIHNMDKRQRVLLKGITDHKIMKIDLKQPQEKMAKLDRTILKQKLAVQTNDLPPLEHVFAEGIELMISDLALLPSVHAYLSAYADKMSIVKSFIPNTMLWYHRLQSIPEILCAAQSCGVKLLDVHSFTDDEERKTDKANCEILKLRKTSDHEAGEQMKKKDLDKTIRRDLPGILSRINPIIPFTYKEFKQEDIALKWNELPENIHPVKGELSTKRAKRKCQQIENLFHAVRSICCKGDTIVDFCAGGGHVGIVIAYMLPECKVVLVDNKEESLERARSRIQALALSNISVYQCNLQNYRGHFNIGVALHACGVATDMVLRKCLNKKASYVVSPCCYGRIKDTELISFPQSREFKMIPLTSQELSLLGHGGDQTSWNFDGEKPKQGKHCMGLVDLDRNAFAQEEGYTTRLYSLQPHDCSPKNNLIIGTPPDHVLTNTNLFD